MKGIKLIHMIHRLSIWAVLGMLSLQPLSAQYFGQNKVVYRNFDFLVYEGPHFEMYHYFKNDSVRDEFMQSSEQWYQMHQEVFHDPFDQPNPMIIYQNHADFQQTKVIGGFIDQGTGGVTEGFKNRIVMPMMPTHRQTDHVLGHELVHAFQYNLILHGDQGTSIRNMQNIPLWMVEGLAEYMSTGRVDPHTAMWMRDAVLQDDLPSLKDLTNNPNYFPYRYGQAFWTFVTGVWGDKIIRPLFVATAKVGYERALEQVIGINAKTISNMWQSTMKRYYEEKMESHNMLPAGRLMVSDLNAGEMNISPALSPDGNFMAFLSEKQVLSTDIYVSDTRTGKILKRLSSLGRQSHIDAYSFLESAGSWSPDSRKFAIVAFAKGQNQLILMDVAKKGKDEVITIPGVVSFSHPAWSPDGNHIAFTGLKEGQSDIYLFNLNTRKVTNLTDDIYSDIQPSWSPDGKYLIYASDRVGARLDPLTKAKFGISVLDVAKGEVATINVFAGADNLNPVFSPDQQHIYFLSNRDGFRDLYEYELKTKQVYQRTKFFTGISGITEFSPAISMAREQDLLTYTLYIDNAYRIYKTRLSELPREAVSSTYIDMSAALLPPHLFPPEEVNIVNPNLAGIDLPEPVETSAFNSKKYRPKFKLDQVTNTSLGIPVSQFGTGLVGGVSGLFSDMLGHHQVLGTVSMNGEITDVGAQLTYLNQKHRIHWGLSLSHIPFRLSRPNLSIDTVLIGGDPLEVTNFSTDIIRIFEDQVSAFTYYPLNTYKRVEVGGSLAFYNFRQDRISNFFDGFGNFIGQDRERLDAPEGFQSQRAYAAFVGDRSTFGLASPLKGERYRFQVEKYFGELDYYAVLADYRRYKYVKPFSLGFRAYHYARYGADAEADQLNPLFLGLPTLMHGLDSRSLATLQNNGVSFSPRQLLGSRMLVANVEVRFPFTGNEKLSWLPFRFLPSDLVWFFDAGVVWDSNSRPVPKLRPEAPEDRVPVFTTGIGMRVNAFGYLIVEPFYAIPIRNGEAQKGVFGINFYPGW